MTSPKPLQKPTPEQLLAANGQTVPDVIAPRLKVIFCGINPGLYTAAVGHHFARPGNRFWKALFNSGFTPGLLAPCEEHKLLEYGCGITNIVERATGSAAELSPQELSAGARRLEIKVAEYAPQWLAVLGISAYRTAFAQPKAILGVQDKTIGGANVWVLPNPSGLNAHFHPPELARLFHQFRLAVEASAD